MGQDIFIILAFFIVGLLVFLGFIWFVMKINRGAFKLQQDRSNVFKEFSKKYKFTYQGSLDKEIHENIKKSYLMGNKQINPPVNMIMTGNALVEPSQRTENTVYCKVKDGEWYIFDYIAYFGYGSKRDAHRCTAFLKIYKNKTDLKEIKILRRTIFDFLKPLNFNQINLNKVDIDKKGFNLKYRAFGNYPQNDKLNNLIDYLSINKRGLDAELFDNVAIVYTNLMSYNLLETDKIEETFLKLKEIL